jgi:hypothetical protein
MIFEDASRKLFVVTSIQGFARIYWWLEAGQTVENLGIANTPESLSQDSNPRAARKSVLGFYLRPQYSPAIPNV